MKIKNGFNNCISLIIFIISTYSTHATFDDTLAWLCTPVSSIKLVDEFDATKIVSKDFQLKNLIVLIRHGDRGPLLPIRNLDSVYCDPNDFGVINNTVNTELLEEYLLAVNTNKVKNVSVPTDSHCHTNQLTRTGILQELTLGSQLGKLYRTIVGLKFDNSVKAYTTPSIRTYESAYAFLYGFLQPKTENNFEIFPEIIKTSGYDFCLDSKYCDQNYTVINRNSTNTGQQYSITTIAQAINYIQYFAPFVASNQSDTKLFNTPTQIGDAIITYFCHNASIPCVDKNNTEVCADSRKTDNFTEFALALVNESSKWQSIRNENLRIMYAFLNNIFTITSSNSTDENLVLFSAHDDTIISFLSAIGAYDGSYPSFASRVVIENYVKITEEDEKQSFMRIVYNGLDVTQFTDYCTSNATQCLSHESGIKLINVNKFNEFIVDKFNSIYETNV